MKWWLFQSDIENLINGRNRINCRVFCEVHVIYQSICLLINSINMMNNVSGFEISAMHLSLYIRENVEKRQVDGGNKPPFKKKKRYFHRKLLMVNPTIKQLIV